MDPPPSRLLPSLTPLASVPPAPRLTLGCPVLDGLLRGGVLTGGITEIVGEERGGEGWKGRAIGARLPCLPPLSLFSPLSPGEATAGKTQLALRLLLTAQLPRAAGGLDGAALYFYTEGGDAPLRRLAELARHVDGM